MGIKSNPPADGASVKQNHGIVMSGHIKQAFGKDSSGLAGSAADERTDSNGFAGGKGDLSRTLTGGGTIGKAD